MIPAGTGPGRSGPSYATDHATFCASVGIKGINGLSHRFYFKCGERNRYFCPALLCFLVF